MITNDEFVYSGIRREDKKRVRGEEKGPGQEERGHGGEGRKGRDLERNGKARGKRKGARWGKGWNKVAREGSEWTRKKRKGQEMEETEVSRKAR